MENKIMTNESHNKNDLLKDVSLTLDFDKLPPEEQKEILSFIEFIKGKRNNKNSNNTQNQK